MKFYRLTLVIAASLVAAATVAQLLARNRALLPGSLALLLLTAIVWIVMRYPKRLIYRGSAALLGLLYLTATVAMFHSVVRPRSWVWSIAGAVTSIAILGSITMAMILGHWYLVVRGMPIDPLKRLTHATLASSIAKVLVVTLAVAFAGSQARDILVTQGIFFWMRAGWGLIAPLALYPMVWGTVKIRSTMAATGILYVDVVAVVIGEVLGTYLSSIEHLPL